MDTHLDIRPSAIAGRWYPAEASRLANTVDGYLQAAGAVQFSGQVVGVMAPHAGHQYSGPVAGYAFAALRGLHPETVVVLAPMHHPYSQPLLTTAHAAYRTPLGLLPVDRPSLLALSDQLEAELGFGLTPVFQDPEHSLEIELPFLQRALDGEFKLIPIMVRDQTLRTARVLGNALALILEGRDALLVASTDLSHFYPQAVANSLDREILHRVEAFDPEGVIQVEEQGRGFACGRTALAATLWAARGLGANCVKILRHTTSGEITGDYSQVVGYAAAVITRLDSSASLSQALT